MPELTVRQLTVREAADLLDSLATGWKVHAIDILMDGREPGLPSPLIFAATGTDYDSFPLDIPPDDLPGLYDQVEAANPFLTATLTRRLERVASEAEKLAQELEKLQADLDALASAAEPDSAAPPSPSSSSASATP